MHYGDLVAILNEIMDAFAAGLQRLRIFEGDAS
jgi:hypothetical protein